MDIIKELFEEINDDNFLKFKILASNIIKFVVLKQEDITRNIYLEKIYDYLDTVNIKNNIDPKKNEYASIYVTSLISLIDIKTNKNSRVEKYFKKAKNIESTIKNNNENCIEPLKDFTRIFTCLYTLETSLKKTIDDFDFSISYKTLEKAINKLKKEKRTGFLWIKEKDIVDTSNRYSKMTYILFMMELIYLSMLSSLEDENHE